MLYTNGKVPLTVVSVVLDHGYDAKGRYWDQRLTPQTAARWSIAVAYGQRKWNVTMRIRAGANAYRSLAWQTIARADACAAGNCSGASVVGYSSHGGNWQGRDCLAIDVDPQGLTWAQVWEACRAGGFSVGLITQAISGIPGGEPWHVIDFAAFGAMPADSGSTPFPTPLPTPTGDNDMRSIHSPGRGLGALLGPNGPFNYRSQAEADQGDALAGAGNVLHGNDAQYDYWISLSRNTAAVAPSPADIAKEVLWNSFVTRGTGKVAVIQELADAKTNTIELLARPGGSVAALSDADLAAIAKAVNDEAHRRSAE